MIFCQPGMSAQDVLGDCISTSVCRVPGDVIYTCFYPCMYLCTSVPVANIILAFNELNIIMIVKKNNVFIYLLYFLSMICNIEYDMNE